MTLSGVLDVVIGIVFVWILLSLVISAVSCATCSAGYVTASSGEWSPSDG